MKRRSERIKDAEANGNKSAKAAYSATPSGQKQVQTSLSRETSTVSFLFVVIHVSRVTLVGYVSMVW